MATVFGSITSGGGVTINSGQITSASRIGQGKYQVDLAAGTFSSTPVVVATVIEDGGECGGGGTNRTISVTHATDNQICLAIRVASTGNENSDRPFNFIAMASS